MSAASAEERARLLAWYLNQKEIAARKAEYRERYSHPSGSAAELIEGYAPAAEYLRQTYLEDDCGD